MLLITGLGNPGQKYKNTRHNIGFIITGHLAEKHGISGGFSSKFNAIIGKGKINGVDAIIAQPQTYMNRSGDAVSAILRWYGLELSSLFVVYDDISLDFGRLRVRPSGSAGSHNGIKSIIASCGSEEFSRLKIGIGPNPGEHLWSSYVLQPFAEQEKKDLPDIIDTSIKGIECFVAEGIDTAQNKYNGINIIEGE